MNEMTESGRTLSAGDDFVSEIKEMITRGMERAYSAVGGIQVLTYWNIGRRIVEQEQKGNQRAEYGTALMELLAEALTKEFGKSYSKRNLQYYRKFYRYFPDVEIVNACVHNLSWSHFRFLLTVQDETERLWYLNEASKSGWSARVLDRNIATQYYYRLLNAPEKEAVVKEMKMKTETMSISPFELLKSPIVAEFLGYAKGSTYLENDLESAILSHLQDFLMEMGRGFAFVARQQHIVTNESDYFIDLVFFNIELNCYVLIDLKMGKITHQDVGQMDMYVRMYDTLKRKPGQNPTIGILLCSKTDEDIARFSVLHDNDRLFMSKYLTYLPTKDQLKREIEREKELYYLQHPESIKDDSNVSI